MSMDCPYCLATLDDPSDCNEPDVTHEYECDECEKKFVFRTEYSVGYDSYQADCLNGAPHKFVERCGYPEHAMVGRYRCQDCEKEETRWAERVIKLKALKVDDWEKPFLSKCIEYAEKQAELHEPKNPDSL